MLPIFIWPTSIKSSPRKTMPTLGLSMIVKNEEEMIRPCLESLRGITSQIVIADTGSTDRTVEIAREFGARVFPYTWTDHFGDARNAALAQMTTDWVLSLDADEELDVQAGPAIKNLMRARDVAGYVLPVRNYTRAKEIRAGSVTGVPNDSRHPRAENAGTYFIYEKCRLFRRDPKIFFTGRVHEQVEVTIRSSRLKLQAADCCIHNFGLLSAHADMRKKLVYYRDLLRMRVKEEPFDFRGWTYLGRMEYDSFNNRGEALRNFHRALELNPGCIEARLFTAMIYLDLGRASDALPFLDFTPPDNATALQKYRLLGDAFSQLGRLQDSHSAYRDALNLCARDVELESKLGFMEVQLGLAEVGIRRLETVAATSPARVDVVDRLMKAYIVLNILPKAAAAAELLARLAPSPRVFLRAASIYAQYRNWPESARLLRQGIEFFPNAQELKTAYSESLAFTDNLQ
jgi:glycosyltransferase involved in cell wall biosynthesis